MKEEVEGQQGKAHGWLGSRIRFEVLLGAFALYFVYAALAHGLGVNTKGGFGKLLSGGLLTALLSASALAVSARRATRYALLGFLLIVVVTVVVTHVQEQSRMLEHVLMAGFVAWVSILIIRGVWKLEEANSQAIAAALCAFLMLGLFWALLYSLIWHIDSAAFGSNSLEVGGDEPLTPFYFSFVTLTTLGYGDIAPVSAPARVFSILEAIVGQVFLVVLVARLVGLSISHPAGRRR